MSAMNPRHNATENATEKIFFASYLLGAIATRRLGVLLAMGVFL